MNIVKLQDIKSTHRNPLHSYTLIMRKRKEKETIPFTIATKRIKYSGMYLPKETKDLYISSFQFNRSVMSDSLWPHESQHARPPCPSATPRVHSNPCPWSRWCHPAMSSSVVPFSSCPQSLPASGSFPMGQLRMRWPKYWSFSFSINPSNEHPGLISLGMDWLDL